MIICLQASIIFHPEPRHAFYLSRLRSYLNLFNNTVSFKPSIHRSHQRVRCSGACPEAVSRDFGFQHLSNRSKRRRLDCFSYRAWHGQIKLQRQSAHTSEPIAPSIRALKVELPPLKALYSSSFLAKEGTRPHLMAQTWRISCRAFGEIDQRKLRAEENGWIIEIGLDWAILRQFQTHNFPSLPIPQASLRPRDQNSHRVHLIVERKRL